jgi:hypothetical protein
MIPPTTAPASCGAEKPLGEAEGSEVGRILWLGVMALAAAVLLDLVNMVEMLGVVKSAVVCMVGAVVPISPVETGTAVPSSAVKSAGRQLSWIGLARVITPVVVEYALSVRCCPLEV